MALSKTCLRQLRASTASCKICAFSVDPVFGRSRPPARSLSTTPYLQSSTESSTLPRVAQPFLWRSIIPRPFRGSSDAQSPSAPKNKAWNPATIFIVLGLLVGSQSIQLIALRNETLAFSRKADAKIALLKEVIRRVQAGEDVDVEKMLGTGVEAQEKEWVEVMNEIETSDTLWQKKQMRRAQRKEEKAAITRSVEHSSTDSASMNSAAAKAGTSSDYLIPPRRQAVEYY